MVSFQCKIEIQVKAHILAFSTPNRRNHKNSCLWAFDNFRYLLCVR